LLLACGNDNSQRAETRALLERIAMLDLRASPTRRGEQVQALRALPLSDPALARVRDRCATAHAGLLSAENEQAEARERLDSATGQAAKVDQAALAAIAASVAHAKRTLGEAQGALDECQRSLRVLAAGPR
jgi:hypothetical protein